MLNHHFCHEIKGAVTFMRFGMHTITCFVNLLIITVFWYHQECRYMDVGFHAKV